MPLRKLLQRINTPDSELDRERLRTFCTNLPGVTPISDSQPRAEVSVVGEISSLRIVPRAGSPSLEAVIKDGTGTLVVAWTGRRQIAGVAPGRRLIVSGRVIPQGPKNRLLILNPRYELL